MTRVPPATSASAWLLAVVLIGSASRALRPCAAAGYCLEQVSVRTMDSPVPEGERENIRWNGDPSPLGIFRYDWTSAQLVSEVFKILTEEVLGYNVTYSASGPGTMDGVYALAGCTSTPPEELICGDPAVLTHVAMEAWESSYSREIQDLWHEYPEYFPERMGMLGYFGWETLFVTRGPQTRGFNNGTLLDTYRSYDAEWGRTFGLDASLYFSRPWSLEDYPGSEFKRCSDTSDLTSDARLREYLQHSNDSAGVVNQRDSNGALEARCWQTRTQMQIRLGEAPFIEAASGEGHWWLSPACRANFQQCIPVVHHPAGYAVDEFMQKASAYRMPLALAVARSEARYLAIPQVSSVLISWWTPNAQFVNLGALPVIFPSHNASAWPLGNKQTSTRKSFLVKFAVKDFYWMAKRAFNMLQSLSIPTTAIDGMLLASRLNATATPRDIACTWLQTNVYVWEPWIPEATSCRPGEGLTNSQGAFVQNRSLALSCEQCMPGYRSHYQIDARGPTYSCEACQPGLYQPSVGQEECHFCGLGRYNPLSGQVACSRCPLGGICQGLHEGGHGATSFVADRRFWVLGSMDDIIDRYRERADAVIMETTLGFDRVGPFLCPAEEACTGNNTCILGPDGFHAHHGPMCGACAPGYQKNRDWVVCNQCPPQGLNQMIFGAIILAFATFILILDHTHGLHVGTVRGVGSVIIKIACNFFTLLSVINSNIRLGETLDSFSENGLSASLLVLPMKLGLTAGEIAKDPGSGVISFSCLVDALGSGMNPNNFLIFLAWIIIPLAAVVCLIKVMIFACFCSKSRRQLGISYREHVYITWHPLFILVIYFIHPMLTSNLLAIMGCTDINLGTDLKYDTPRLVHNMMIDCHSEVHKFWTVMGLLGIVFWSFGIPLVLFLILYRINNSDITSLSDLKILRMYGFLYNGLQIEHYYFELVFMLRRTSYLFAAKMHYLSSDTRVCLLMVLNSIFLYMQVTFAPFDDRVYGGLDTLERISSYTIILLLLARMFMIFTPDEYNPVQPDILVYVPCVLCFLDFVRMIIYTAIRGFFWPMDGPPHKVPQVIQQFKDRRLYITHIPPEKLHSGQHEHARLAHTDANAHTEELAPFADIVQSNKPGTKLKTVDYFEFELTKVVIEEVVEAIIQRSEISMNTAPDIIGIPTFIVQIERMLACCTCQAIKTRLGAQKHNRENLKRLGSQFEEAVVAGSLSKTISKLDNLVAGEEVKIDWSRDNPALFGEHSSPILTRPVCIEEMYVALMTMLPEVLSSQQGKAAHAQYVLRDYASRNAGILNMFSNQTALFDRDLHRMRVDYDEQAILAFKIRHARAMRAHRNEEPMSLGQDKFVDPVMMLGMEGVRSKYEEEMYSGKDVAEKLLVGLCARRDTYDQQIRSMNSALAGLEPAAAKIDAKQSLERKASMRALLASDEELVLRGEGPSLEAAEEAVLEGDAPSLEAALVGEGPPLQGALEAVDPSPQSMIVLKESDRADPSERRPAVRADMPAVPSDPAIPIPAAVDVPAAVPAAPPAPAPQPVVRAELDKPAVQAAPAQAMQAPEVQRVPAAGAARPGAPDLESGLAEPDPSRESLALRSELSQLPGGPPQPRPRRANDTGLQASLTCCACARR